jgi:hypothetical protein
MIPSKSAIYAAFIVSYRPFSSEKELPSLKLRSMKSDYLLVCYGEVIG